MDLQASHLFLEPGFGQIRAIETVETVVQSMLAFFDLLYHAFLSPLRTTVLLICSSRSRKKIFLPLQSTFLAFMKSKYLDIGLKKVPNGSEMYRFHDSNFHSRVGPRESTAECTTTMAPLMMGADVPLYSRDLIFPP